jgi:hypothetical protein
MAMASQAHRCPVAAHLIHRTFWSLGLFPWACWYEPFPSPSLSDWSLLVLGSGPFLNSRMS